MISADEITKEQFQEIQGRYNDLVKSISKPARKGDETLEDLDTFRYEEAPEKYCQPDPKKKDQRLVIPLEAEDLVRLVAWKLKHGHFRPQLMKLAKSNEEDTVLEVTKEAFTIYENDPSNIKAVMKKLTELKGVGPATAALLLSIHDKDNVPFFGDEVFWWLCRDGHQASPKYNAKEYEELIGRFKEVRERLGGDVGALDFERVGYVIMREEGKEGSMGGGKKTEKPGKVEEKETEKEEDKPAKAKKPGKAEVKKPEKPEKKPVEKSPPVAKANEKKKRKSMKDEETAEVEPRRSKRGKT